MDAMPVMMITGTSKGIGKGIAEFFVKNGYRVAGCSRGSSTIEDPNYFHAQVDVTDEKQVQVWVRSVRQHLKQIDVLVCNVGLVKGAVFTALIPGQVFNEFLQTNLASTFYVCREVSKVMSMKKSGRLINIASIMTELHEPGTAAYSATKSGVIELTKVMARELASIGITCNVISPCMVETDSSKELGSEWADRMLNMQTIRRPARIEEICHLISFYASPNAACITGQVIHMGLVN